MGGIEVWDWPGQHIGSTLKKKGKKKSTEFNYELKFHLASFYFHIFTTMGSISCISPVHTLTPDPFHGTIFLNSENYNEANALDSMADSAKLWNLLSTTSWIWVHLFVQCARQNHASKSQNQTMPSILLEIKPAQKAVSCDVGALIQELPCSLWLLPLNPKHKKVHETHGILS